MAVPLAALLVHLPKQSHTLAADVSVYHRYIGEIH